MLSFMADLFALLIAVLICLGSFWWSIRHSREKFWFESAVILSIFLTVSALFSLGVVLESQFLFLSPIVVILLAAVLWLLYAFYLNAKLGWRMARQANKGITDDEISLLVEDTDDWESIAIALFRQKQELSAIELVQESTGLDFEQSRVKLYKLDGATSSNSPFAISH